MLKFWLEVDASFIPICTSKLDCFLIDVKPEQFTH